MSPDAIQSMIAENTRLLSQVEDLTNQLEWFKRQVFGQKSERTIPSDDTQCTLALEGVPTSSPLPAATQTITYARKNPNANKTPHGRDEIPAHIPRVIIPIEPKYDTKNMEKVGEKITEQLEYKPPEFYVKRFVRPVHATIENGERTLICPELPPFCIEKGKLGPTVVAQTIRKPTANGVFTHVLS